ncbi:MAG: hypothetical protein U1E45_18980 [Geminicoccaceae bacterium]
MKRYLAENSDEADLRRLALLLDLPADAPARLARGVPLARADRKRLEANCRSEIARGDFVYVGGWVMARSEARLIALQHLTGDMV